jgi:hypothetical protein
MRQKSEGRKEGRKEGNRELPSPLGPWASRASLPGKRFVIISETTPSKYDQKAFPARSENVHP